MGQIDEILTKEDIGYIFEVIMLNMEGIKLIDTQKHPKHIIIANDVYDLIKRKW